MATYALCSNLTDLLFPKQLITPEHTPLMVAERPCGLLYLDDGSIVLC